MKLGPKEVTCSVGNSVRVRELKQRLIDGGAVGFPIDDFSLIFTADDNNDDIPLVDESLLLHLYCVGDNTTIRIISGNLQIYLVSHRNEKWCKSFPRSITIRHMKQRIRRFLGNDKDMDDIWLFVQHGESYQKLDGEDDEAPIDSVPENDVIFLFEDRFFPVKHLFPTYYKGEEVGRVGWKIAYEMDINRCWYYYSETALSLKLRTQVQLGFPVSCVDVKFEGRSTMQNDERIKRNSEGNITCRIEVA